MPERLTIIPVIPTQPDILNPAIEQYGMVWANNAEMTGAQDLATTTVDTGLIWIRGTTITADRAISHVSMYVDGIFIRDDPAAPYDVRPANGVEVTTGTHVCRMVYHYLDASTPTTVDVSFPVTIPPGTGVVAHQSDQFVDSIGINTHIGYTDRTYGSYTSWKQLLIDSGIRHVRDGFAKGQDFVYDRMIELSTAAGIRWDVLIGRPYNGIFGGPYTGDPLTNAPQGTYQEILDTVRDYPGLLAVVGSLEGANEYDISGDGNWATNLRIFSEAVWNYQQADTSLRGLPMVGPSFVYAGSRKTYADLIGAGNYMDVGNMHSYTGGRAPTAQHLDEEIALNGQVSGPGKDLWITETGYHTATSGSFDQQGVTEATQAIFYLRQYLENFRKGIPRTYEYEFLDEYSTADSEGRYGIVSHTYSPKPAYHALQRFINLLEDPGADFAPTPLDYTITGTNTRTRQLLLQKRNGDYYLAVWQEAAASGTGHVTESVNVTLTLPRTFDVALYIPNTSALPQSTSSTTTSFAFASTETVKIIKLVPSASTGWPGGDLAGGAPLRTDHTAMSLGINRVGYWADAPGLHIPVTLKAPRGSFATTSAGQVIEREDVNGGITILHDNVTVQNCRVDYITNRGAYANCTVRWNVIGKEVGMEGRQGVLIGGNFYAYRNWMVGGIDIMKWDDGIGNWEIRENILGPYYMMLNDPHQNSDTDWRSHNDTIQDQYGGTKFWLIDNRIECFAYQGYEWTSGSQPSGTNGDIHSGTSLQTRITPNPRARDAMGKFPSSGYNPNGTTSLRATSGILIQDSGGRSSPSKRAIRDLRIDGNYWDGDTYAYIQLSNSIGGGPTGYIARNIFRRRYTNGGSRAVVEGGDYGAMGWGVGNAANRWDTPTGDTAVPRPAGFKDYTG